MNTAERTDAPTVESTAERRKTDDEVEWDMSKNLATSLTRRANARFAGVVDQFSFRRSVCDARAPRREPRRK
ncbi:MAG TPA: hypothetical protein VLC09_00180 [Polyangiaceae bacterium]|nr:hypothetical protein [Polyangiaceae bacterium]